MGKRSKEDEEEKQVCLFSLFVVGLSPCADALGVDAAQKSVSARAGQVLRVRPAVVV